MATTTTNYGFDVPTSSDLVKNGATQIALLGQDLDTFLFRPFSKNFLINSDFDIWQRSTSSTSNGAYNSADRWWMYYGAGTATFSRESTIIPTGSTYSLKIAQSVATNTNLQVLQSIESANATAMAGKTVTISGLFAASASTTLGLDVVYSTATDVAPSGSWTAATTVTAGTGTVTTTASFSRITGVYTIPSTAKSVMARVTSSSVTSGTSVYVSQIQLEIGTQYTPFTRAGATIQGELAACQRYYYRFNGSAVSNYIATGFAFSSTVAYAAVPHPTTMRTIPSFGSAAASNFGVLGAGGSSGSAVSGSNLNVDTFVFNYTQSSGLTANSGLLLYGSTNAYYELSAEL